MGLYQHINSIFNVGGYSCLANLDYMIGGRAVSKVYQSKRDKLAVLLVHSGFDIMTKLVFHIKKIGDVSQFLGDKGLMPLVQLPTKAYPFYHYTMTKKECI